MLGQQRGAMFVSWAFVRPNEQKTLCVNKLLERWLSIRGFSQG